MTSPIELSGVAPSRADALAGTPGRRVGAGPSGGGVDGGPTFAELVERAAADGGRPGGLVETLPSGRAEAAWTNWRPPTQALGIRSGGGGAIDRTGPSRSVLPTGFTAGATGAVFPAARSAGEAVVNAAAEHLGVPYLWGGTDPIKGFDCSGLIQDAYRQIGVEMPKWSRHQATMGVEVPSIDQAVPGDILTFGQPVNHVALYVGDGRMLHAPRTGEVVKIEDIDRPINSIRRVVTPTPSSPLSGLVGPGGSTGATGSTSVGAGTGGLAAPGTEPLGDVPYRDLFAAAGQRWDVDPALLAAVARAESAFNPEAVSPVGAQGLMQFMPQTAAEMGVDPWDPASAIDGAARYLRNSLDRFGSVELAVASYNAGPGAVARYDGIPPYPETQNYVRTVLDAWRR